MEKAVQASPLLLPCVGTASEARRHRIVSIGRTKESEARQRDIRPEGGETALTVLDEPSARETMAEKARETEESMAVTAGVELMLRETREAWGSTGMDCWFWIEASRKRAFRSASRRKR